MSDTAVDTRGQRLRRALERSRKKAGEVAATIGVSPALMSHYLNDRRNPPADVLQRIARELGVSLSSLERGDGESSSRGRGAARRATARMDREFREALSAGLTPLGAWRLRPAPADGGRDYGNSNVHVAKWDLEKTIRELLQNCIDQILGARLTVRFQLIELTKGSPQYNRFLTAIGMDDIGRNIEAASELPTRLATKLRRGLDNLKDGEKLILLRCDDYGTTGLYGAEPTADGFDDGRPNPYAALTRNNMDSAKSDSRAGGSYGLGKGTQQNASELGLVFYASRIAPRYVEGDDAARAQQAKLRVVGKTDLSWHRLATENGNEAFAGPGWFGEPVEPMGTVHSLWIDDRAHANALQLDRDELPPTVDEQDASGTSVLIVGFRDPDADTQPAPIEICQKIARAAAVNFFPAIAQQRLTVHVEHVVDGEQKYAEEVDPSVHVPRFWDAYRKHRDQEVTQELAEAGDVARYSFRMRIPATQDGAKSVEKYPELDAECLLVVRRSDESERDDLPHNTVALVRGRGMVTEYQRKDNVVTGAPPFDAILLAGEAVDTAQAQKAAEQFLRLAEPAAHDSWSVTDEVRGKYKRGYAITLNGLPQAIIRGLRELLKPALAEGDEGPEELKRLLQLTGGKSPVAPPATLRRPDGVVRDGRWDVTAEIKFNDRTNKYSLTPRLAVVLESGGTIHVPWEQLEVRQPDGSWTVVEGDSFNADFFTRNLAFRARSQGSVQAIDVAQCRTRLDLAADRLKTGRETT